MIKTLPARAPEIGRFRLGDKDDEGKMRKLTTWRATANDELTLQALAAQLGGDVKPWPDGEQLYQVTTTSDTVDILIPADSIFTAFERWGSGGCQRRCDGEMCSVPVMGPDGGQLVETACECLEQGWTPGDRDDVKKGACTVQVRFKFVIPAVPGLGVWVLTSHSVYAAMEMPGQLALLEAMSQRGVLIPATLAIEPRSEKKPWEKFTREYLVPVIRVRKSLQQIQALASGAVPIAALESGGGPSAMGNDSRPADESVSPVGSTDRSGRTPASPSQEKQTVSSRAIYTQATRAGLDRTQVHAIVGHVTGGATTSTADLDIGPANDVLKLIGEVKAGKVEVVANDDGEFVVRVKGQESGEEPF